MEKKPLVIGNWKMELSHKGALEAARNLGGILAGKKKDPGAAEVVVCPSFPSLSAVAEVVKKAGVIGVGAQTIHWEEKGAFTGFVSVQQVREWVKWCLLGHSEQRQWAGESDEGVLHKTQMLLSHGITPVVCIGESAEERAGDQVVDKISQQMEGLLANLGRVPMGKLTIAYEPIWAIGTGTLPEADEVAEVVLLIRKLIAGRFDMAVADKVRILYGGSVNEDNVGQYVGGPGADGVLVGGASLKPRQFAAVVSAVESAWG